MAKYIYDKEAQDILGRAAFKLLRTAASEGQIDEQKMRDISVKLHPDVGGNHRRRGGRSGTVEMREVLSDWYELHYRTVMWQTFNVFCSFLSSIRY